MSCSWAALTFSSLPCHAFSTLAWRALPKEKVSAHGFLPGYVFIAFKLIVESHSDCPPDRKVIPGIIK